VIGRAVAVAGVALVAASGCTGARAVVPAREATVDEHLAALREARAWIADVRAAAARSRTEAVRVVAQGGPDASVWSARGAVAVGPPDRLRLILVGPGGGTGIDLWSGPDRERVRAPVLDDAPAAVRDRALAALPRALVRWWLLAPLSGELAWAERRPGRLTILLTEPGRTTTVERYDDGRVTLVRRTFQDASWPPRIEERVEATGVGCASLRFTSSASAVAVAIECESTRSGASEAALAEPGP
jgi:hypothetical protein